MNLVTIIIDLLAIAAIVTGASMVFGQKRLRSWWASVNNKPLNPKLEAGDDPVRYVLLIFGMMLLAFGIIILGFFTAFAWFSETAG
jgi:formate hydrogenlyase subunit 3/multisubunit Na+/H+ antiporter MnhD subunit